MNISLQLVISLFYILDLLNREPNARSLDWGPIVGLDLSAKKAVLGNMGAHVSSPVADAANERIDDPKIFS